MLRKLTNNKKGFTLIELMIVIAIIGILAAIAIPNFISYRNKSYCSQAESDAGGTLSAISDYFSEPEHTTLPEWGDLRGFMPKNGTGSVDILGAASGTIYVVVTDTTHRCPRDTSFHTYRMSMPKDTVNDGWDNTK